MCFLHLTGIFSIQYFIFELLSDSPIIRFHLEQQKLAADIREIGCWGGLWIKNASGLFEQISSKPRQLYRWNLSESSVVYKTKLDTNIYIGDFSFSVNTEYVWQRSQGDFFFFFSNWAQTMCIIISQTRAHQPEAVLACFCSGEELSPVIG